MLLFDFVCQIVRENILSICQVVWMDISFLFFFLKKWIFIFIYPYYLFFVILIDL